MNGFIDQNDSLVVCFWNRDCVHEYIRIVIVLIAVNLGEMSLNYNKNTSFPVICFKLLKENRGLFCMSMRDR